MRSILLLALPSESRVFVQEEVCARPGVDVSYDENDLQGSYDHTGLCTRCKDLHIAEVLWIHQGHW